MSFIQRLKILVVEITIIDQGSTPQEVGWLYDFYTYRKMEGAFLTGYSVEIIIDINDDVSCHINFNNEKEFSNEDEFYAAFKAGRVR